MRTDGLSDLRSRLVSAAKTLGLRMPQVQLLLAQERFLLRIASVDLNQNMIWKGGSLILRRYSHMKPPRFTSDVDLMVKGATVLEGEELIREAAILDLCDGFKFLEITQFPMERETPYGGERFEITWTFQKKKNSEPLRIDICAGDDVDARKIRLDEVYLLDDDASKASLLVYPPEFIFAEKLETLVRFGTGNTRLKDFIDLWALIQLPEDEFSRNLCVDAIQRCFKRRDTTLNAKRWKKVLNDQVFQDLMEEAKKRNFPNLELPQIPEMFATIEAFLEQLAKEENFGGRK